jgi:methyl-accepting chemotaxis protein
MSWFLDKRIGTKLILGFATVLALTAVLGVVAIAKLAAVRATTVDMAENWMVSINALNNMRFAMATARRMELRMIIAKTAEEDEELGRSVDTAMADFKKNQAIYVPTITGPEERKFYDDIAATSDEFAGDSHV